MNNGSGEDNTPATNLQANNTEQEPLNEAEELAQAFNILSTLESRSLQDPSTQADLDRLEEIYNTSRTRQGKLTTLRGQKQSQLEQAMSRAGLTNLQKKDVRETKNARENFDTEIVAVLNPLGISQADKEAITSLAKTVAVITHDLRLIDRYLSNYLRLRASLCTTDDASNDPYTKGMVTMTHGGARKVDACIASNTQIRQYVCQNLREPSNSPTETDCAYGCSLGACKKGQINDLKWFDAATGGNELTEPYDEGHDFWLEVDSSVANPHNETLTYEISAYRALNNDNCTLANTTGAIQEGDNEKVRIGPINCNNSGTDTWTVRLKHGDAETAKKTVVGAI